MHLFLKIEHFYKPKVCPREIYFVRHILWNSVLVSGEINFNPILFQTKTFCNSLVNNSYKNNNIFLIK